MVLNTGSLDLESTTGTTRTLFHKFQSKFCYCVNILFLNKFLLWHRRVFVNTTTQLHSTKPELRFCAGPNPAYCVLEIRVGDLEVELIKDLF